MTRALQERLGTVDRLDAPQTSAYDAIIVLRRGPAVVAPKGHPVTENAYGSYANLIEFDIVRGGQKVTSGVARLEPYQTRDEIERQKGEHLQPVQLSNVYEESRTIARAVVDAIKRTAS